MYIIYSEGYASEMYETTDSRRLLEFAERAHKDYGGTVVVAKIVKQLTTVTNFTLKDI